MSTNNLPGMQPGRNAMGRIAQAARSRAAAVRQSLEALDSQEEDVRIGAAALLQSIDDDRTPLTEEGEQLLVILSAGQQRQQSQASQPETPVDPLPAIVEQTPSAPVVLPEAPAAPVATEHLPHTRRPTWGKEEMIAAVAGLIIAFLVAVNSRGWVADLADLTTGFGAWAIKAAWILSLSAFGFYITGFGASAVMNRYNSNNHNPGP